MSFLFVPDDMQKFLAELELKMSTASVGTSRGSIQDVRSRRGHDGIEERIDSTWLSWYRYSHISIFDGEEDPHVCQFQILVCLHP